MISVAHLLELYPQRELEFAHAQVRLDAERQDIVLVESEVSGPPLVSREVPVYASRKVRGAGGPFSAHRGWERMYRKVRHSIGWRFWNSRYAAFALPHVRRHRVQLLHAHFGMMGARSVELARRSGLPLVVTFYGADASQCLRDPAWRRRYCDLFREARRVIVLCDAVKQRLEQHGCPPGAVRVWNIGLELEEFAFQSRPDDFAARFLCVARFAEKKGHRLLLEAFGYVAKARPSATLTLIGYGPLKAEVQRRIAAAGLADRVRVIDTEGRSDFKRLFRDALAEHGIFVLASTVARDGDDEAGPALTAVYAQATGMPFVATDFVGVERSLVHNETGLVAKSDDAVDLARQMERLAGDSAWARTLGRRASSFVHDQFALERQLVALDAIYREIL